MKKRRILLILFMLCIMFGCKKTEQEPKTEVKETEPENVIVKPYFQYDEEPGINSSSEYYATLNYYTMLLYNDGYCKDEYVNQSGECSFTLNQLQELLPSYDMKELYSYNNVLCDGNIVS